MSSPPGRTRSGPARALILDHGGVRGMEHAVYMQLLEEMAGCPISEIFDVIAFTSVGQVDGAIVTVPDPGNPGRPKFPASFGVQSFEEFAQKTFPEQWHSVLRQLFGEAKFPSLPLERNLDAILGDARVKESTTSVMYYVIDVETGETRCIRHIRDRENKVVEEYCSDMKISDVVRGGVTAPTVLRVKDYPVDPEDPHSKRRAWMDAGGSSGNVVHEVWHMLGRIAPNEERVIMHLGTGRSEMKMNWQKYNLRGFVGYLFSKEKREHFLNMAFNSASQASVRFMKKMMGDHFFSLSAVIDPNNPDHPTADLDDGRPENMQKHKALAMKTFNDNRAEMERFCRMIKQQPAPLAEKSGVHWSNDNPPPADNVVKFPKIG